MISTACSMLNSTHAPCTHTHTHTYCLSHTNISSCKQMVEPGGQTLCLQQAHLLFSFTFQLSFFLHIWDKDTFSYKISLYCKSIQWGQQTHSLKWSHKDDRCFDKLHIAFMLRVTGNTKMWWKIAKGKRSGKVNLAQNCIQSFKCAWLFTTTDTQMLTQLVWVNIKSGPISMHLGLQWIGS